MGPDPPTRQRQATPTRQTPLPAVPTLTTSLRAVAPVARTCPRHLGPRPPKPRHDVGRNSTRLMAEVSTLQAIVQDRYGEAQDVLRLEEIDRPVIGADEVLLRVHAAGLDRGVWHAMAGLPYPIRLAGCGVRAPKNAVLGTDLAGRVEAIGADVTTLKVGEQVYGAGHGSFAEYSRAAAGKLSPKPKTLSFEQAAAVPVSACTALQAVRDRAKVQTGQQVLVIGASGGVGSYVVQIARS